MQNFAVCRFNDTDILTQTVNHVMNSLVNDKDLPVQVEAGIAISRILDKQSDEGRFTVFLAFPRISVPPQISAPLELVSL